MCALLCLLNLSYVQTHIGVSKLHPKFLLSLNPGCWYLRLQERPPFNRHFLSDIRRGIVPTGRCLRRSDRERSLTPAPASQTMQINLQLNAYCITVFKLHSPEIQVSSTKTVLLTISCNKKLNYIISKQKSFRFLVGGDYLTLSMYSKSKGPHSQTVGTHKLKVKPHDSHTNLRFLKISLTSVCFITNVELPQAEFMNKDAALIK